MERSLILSAKHLPWPTRYTSTPTRRPRLHATITNSLDRRRRRTSDVLVSELDVDDVVAGFRGHILDLTRAVGVVLALDVSLARSFH